MTTTALSDFQRSILTGLATRGRRKLPRSPRFNAAIGRLMIGGLVEQQDWGFVAITVQGRTLLAEQPHPSH